MKTTRVYVTSLTPRDTKVFKSRSTLVLAFTMLLAILVLALVGLMHGTPAVGENCLRIDVHRSRIVATEAGNVLRVYLRNYCGVEVRLDAVEVVQNGAKQVKYLSTVVPAYDSIEITLPNTSFGRGSAIIVVKYTIDGNQYTVTKPLSLHS